MKRIVAMIAAGLFAAALAVPATAGKKSEPWKSYGAEITLKKTTTLAKARPGSEVLIRGKVSEVCQAKGCWMVVADGKQTVRVEFKDYGFFVPWEAEGKPVQLQGVLTEPVMSPEEQAHIAAESKAAGGTKAGDAPVRTRVFVASAVAIQGGGEIGEEQKRKIGGASPAQGQDHHDHGAPGHKH